MAIKYNPYNWKIRTKKSIQNNIKKLEELRNIYIEELYFCKTKNAHHKEFTEVIDKLSEIQHKIDTLWLQSGYSIWTPYGIILKNVKEVFDLSDSNYHTGRDEKGIYFEGIIPKSEKAIEYFSNGGS